MNRAVKFGKISIEDLLKKTDAQLNKELKKRDLYWSWKWGDEVNEVYLHGKITPTHAQKVQMLIQYDAYYRGQNDLLIKQRKKKRERYGCKSYTIERDGESRKFELTEEQAELILYLANNI